MFFERNGDRKIRRRRQGCLGRFVKLLLLVVFCWIVITASTSGTFSGLLHGMIPDGLPGGWRNILLIGTDEVSGGTQRSDALIIASISTGGEVKLTSIMRDTMADIEGHGKHKINAAYAYGGAALAVDTVNRNFGLNISQYAQLDFEGLAALVDAVGGIKIDVTKAEAKAMNKKSGHKLKSFGEKTLLDGIQAVRFARLRKTDSDYRRAGRHRQVIGAILSRIRGMRSPVALIAAGRNALKAVKTNISAPDLMLLGARVLLRGSTIEEYRIPAEGTYESGTQDGVWAIRANLPENQKLLRQFIYGHKAE